MTIIYIFINVICYKKPDIFVAVISIYIFTYTRKGYTKHDAGTLTLFVLRDRIYETIHCVSRSAIVYERLLEVRHRVSDLRVCRTIIVLAT